MLATRARASAVFVLCAAGLTAAMGWVTHRALSLERAEARARALAAQQESMRLALWRMDSTLSTLLAQESARPFFHYLAFYPANRPYDLPLDALAPNFADEGMAPSPLLAGPAVSTLPDALRLYINLWPDGSVSSPQVPPEPMAERAARHLESLGLGRHGLETARTDLAAFNAMFEPRTALATLAGQTAELAPALVSPEVGVPLELFAQSQRGAEQQARVSAKEFEARRQVAQAANVQQLGAGEPAQRQDQPAALAADIVPETDAALRARAGGTAPVPAGRTRREERDARPAPEVGRFQPVWVGAGDTGTQLVLLRSVRAGPRETWQGLWLDWPVLRTHLLRQSADLLPGGDLVPVREPRPADPTTQPLATIPALLKPGEGPTPDALVAGFSPARQAVAVGWTVVALALAAIGLVLREAVLLGERRGRFVSAVTHELRTPLTTFCLYSQMLADGMVGEADRAEYVRTLRDESGRLARIVESVLDYARLGSGRGRARCAPIALTDLVARALPSVTARAVQCGMRLDVDEASLGSLTVSADPAAVERILYNLVDNACKYAADAPDPVIRLRAHKDGESACLRVSDHGPGVPETERASLFKPFRRGRAQETGATPGLGLGLALARGLAREMGGDLRLLSDETDGATFEVRLPVFHGLGQSHAGGG